MTGRYTLDINAIANKYGIVLPQALIVDINKEVIDPAEDNLQDEDNVPDSAAQVAKNVNAATQVAKNVIASAPVQPNIYKVVQSGTKLILSRQLFGSSSSTDADVSSFSDEVVDNITVKRSARIAQKNKSKISTMKPPKKPAKKRTSQADSDPDDDVPLIKRVKSKTGKKSDTSASASDLNSFEKEIAQL